MVFFGVKILDVGAQAIYYNHSGKARLEVGPQRIFLFRQRLHYLQKYTADQNQYLIIKYKNGNVEHKPGPCAVFLNLLEYKSIEVMDTIDLDANEVLVVYRQDPDTKEVVRYLEYGPSRFIPAGNEWLHKFNWHGTDPNNKTRMVMGGLKFTKLQAIPSQFYYNIDAVRTSDDALIRVKLVMNYELINIEQMLSTTSDPIADFINCLSADVITFCSSMTYMEFMERSGELNELSNYPKLTARCKKIGYQIGKVVFRGYYASPKLQALHDVTITKRTEIKLQYEQEEQKQKMIKAKLQSEMKRLALEQSLELDKIQHAQKMEISQMKHTVEIEKTAWGESLQQEKEEEGRKLEAERLANTQEHDYLCELEKLEVDVNKYVLSQNPRPERVIKVCANNEAANIHLHK